MLWFIAYALKNSPYIHTHTTWCRNMFTYLGSIVVFICFLILLTKINKSSGNNLTPADKEIFWVGEILNVLTITTFMKRKGYIINKFDVCTQIMAIAVIVFGLLTVIPFQIVIRENPKIKLPTLRWFKWIQKPEFYLVCK